jgi:predicted RNA-binding protein with PUA-like domain
VNYWLMKSEPNTYSIDTLANKPKGIDHWEGVRNYQARNFMKDQMKIGDQAFFYHSNCEIPGIAGMMKIVQESHPDFTAWDVDSQYYDPKSTPTNPRWFMVSVQFVEKFKTILPLSLLKNQPSLKECVLLQPGNRLSVMPISSKEWKTILSLKKESSE